MSALLTIDRLGLRDLVKAALRRVRMAHGRMRFGDLGTTTICGSCRTGEHRCGGACHCAHIHCGGGDDV